MTQHTITLGGLTITHGGQVVDSSENPTAPRSITRAQGKAVLIQSGLWDGVLQFVSAIPDPTERALAEVALHDTQEWRRESPFLTAAAAALGLSSEQLDAVFATASEIEL